MTTKIALAALGGVMLATGAAAETLKIAAWNVEHFTEGSRTVAELSMMADLVDILDADVIALQEVDGAEAARLIFDPEAYDFHF
jgi:endonuclease/exonuclease/phosphatase family metal-dependent hydrolase